MGVTTRAAFSDTSPSITMDILEVYPQPIGVYAIPHEQLDLRSDSEVDFDLLHPRPVTDDKNIWFFWHSGYTDMHPYTCRNVRAWHRRFSKKGWVVRVLDRKPDSPLNVAKFLNVLDPGIFPRAFVDGTISGDYAPQHTSDLVRWPLLISYGGVYADVGMIQIGDLDKMWNTTLGDPNSPYEVFSYNIGGVDGRNLTNHLLASRRDNPFFQKCHRLFLKLWDADGGKTSTNGMHASPLLHGVPLVGGDLSFEENGKTYGPEECSRLLTDYIIQGQVMTLVMGLVDDEDEWNGPSYVAKHVFAPDFMTGSQLINEMTDWNGPRQFKLLSLSLPKNGDIETPDQAFAREIVESCLTKSFGFKLAHGIIVRFHGATLGSLWRKHDGSDDVPGTYAHWLRYGTIFWCPEDLPTRLKFTEIPAIKIGCLLGEGRLGPGASGFEAQK